MFTHYTFHYLNLCAHMHTNVDMGILSINIIAVIRIHKSTCNYTIYR